MLTVDNLTFSFGERPVLSSVTLHCNSGETIGIVGKSGIGKTTLLNVVAGCLNGYSGKISVGGSPPAEAARRQEIGFIFQTPTLIPWLTVRQNVSLPLAIHRRGTGKVTDELDAALRSARINHAQHLFPHQLSGGMQTRAAIARAIAYHPSLLLMDEPFTGLDDVVKEDLFNDLQTRWLEAQTASVLVSHDLSEVTRLCDRVYVLKTDRVGACQILHSEEINLEKPRGIEVLEDSGFLAARRRIWQHLQ